MNNFNWLKVIVLSVSIIIAGYFIGNMHKNGIAYNRYVQVKGLSEKEVKADLAVWPMQILLTGNDLKLLKGNLEQQHNEVISFFKNLGFSDSEIAYGMVNINDAKATLYSSNNPNDYRYIAKSELTIRTSDIDKLKTAVKKSPELMEKGILLGSKNEWRPVEYIYSGLNSIKPLMIEEATKNAREVAEKFARDSNSKVGAIKVARQGQFSINNRDENTPEIKIVRVVSTIDFQLTN